MADKIIEYHVGLPVVKTSTKHSCNTLNVKTLSELLRLCLPGLTRNGGIDGLRLSRTLTFHTLHGSMEYVKQFHCRSRQSLHQCPVSANASASQLIKKEKYEGANQETYRLAMQELYDL